MDYVFYSVVKNKKPLKIKVFIDKGVVAPAFLKNGNDNYRKVGEIKKSEDGPAAGDFLLKAFTKEEIAKKAGADADSMMKDISKNPSLYENGEKLKKLPRSHWVSEFEKVYKNSGHLTKV